MAQQIMVARSIARPLLADLTLHPFSGWVFGLFERACNLIDDDGRVITLLLPMVGRGPFAISIEGSASLFDPLFQNQPALANRQAVEIGPWYISLGQAEIWEPKISKLERALKIDRFVDLLRPYANWPTLAEDIFMARRLAGSARQAATLLIEAMTQPENHHKLSQAVTQLAGLGGGLTPAGDDFLLGTMAALWLSGQEQLAPLIAETAVPRTTTLSASFLKAGARGEFIEPWHALAQAWVMENKRAVAEAIEWIANFGASSGLDALAGFANTMLNLVNQPVSSNN
jgi:hypothetical protein